MLRSILERPEEGSGSIEKQAANAKALSMLAQVYKVSCSADVNTLAICNVSATGHPLYPDHDCFSTFVIHQILDECCP